MAEVNVSVPPHIAILAGAAPSGLRSAMSPGAQPLPMAPAGCGLDEAQLAEQLARYRKLSSAVLRIERNGAEARILFGPTLQAELLDHAVAVERGCCGFLALDYDTRHRVLTITAGREHVDALTVLVSVLTPPSRGAAGSDGS